MVYDRVERHVVSRIAIATADATVGKAIDALAGSALDYAGVIWIVDGEHRLVGGVRLEDALAASLDTPIGELADPAWPVTSPHYDQEHVASDALEHRAVAVAVNDPDGRLIGAVPPLAILDVLRHEHVEDLHRLAGIEDSIQQARGELEDTPIRRSKHRLPWLIVGLAGSLVAAVVVSRFEGVLDRNVAIAYFVPAIVYLADAIGTQTEAIVVRGLSLSRLTLRDMLARELGTGLIIGSVLAAIALPTVYLAFGDGRIAIAVAIAILVAGAAATTIGLLLPWLLFRAGRDPAHGSGPLATIIQDLLSLVIYLAAASALVG